MNKNTLIISFILILSCSSQSSAVTSNSSFNSIIDSEWLKIISDNPVYASSMGDLRFNTEWSDNSIKKIKLNYEHNLKILEKLNNIDINDLNYENRINYKLFKKQYENSIESHSYETYLMPFSHRGGIQLQHETTSILPLRKTQHYLDWIERLIKIEQLINADIEKAKVGIKLGIVPPRFLMQKVFDQIKLQIFVSPENSPFIEHF